MKKILLRHNILLTTALASAAFFGYYRRAYAACTLQSGSSFLCSGSNTTTQTITANNATVTTAAGFDVAATAGRAISISGAGALSFTDANGSSIVTTANSQGLYIRSTGSSGGIPASVNITTSVGSLVRGGQRGIYARISGTGATTISTSGNVTGTSSDGIFARNSSAINNGGIGITTAETSAVLGGNRGIYAINSGAGATTISTSGNVTGTIQYGIYARNSNYYNTGGISITTAATSAVLGGYRGIYARNYGLVATIISTSGNVTGTNSYGISVYNSSSSTGGINITTAATSAVLGGTNGINASNAGTGNIAITTSGNVTGTSGNGIFARNSSAINNDGISITTADTSAVTGGSRGINAINYGTGATSINTSGNVTGTSGNGIFAMNTHYYNTGGISITTAATSEVQSNNNGIYASNSGTGATTINTSGNVTGTSSDGIFANSTNSYNTYDTSITTAATSTILGGQGGIFARNDGLGATTINTSGNVTGTNTTGIYARNINYSNMGGISITTAATSAVFGGSTGIFARNYGMGATTINTSGNVTGTNQYGIYARNTSAANTGGISITTTATSAVLGGASGIFARNSGMGDIAITTNGAVTGTTIAGINIDNIGAGSTSTIAVNAGSTISGAKGIAANTSNAVAITLANGSSVTGTGGTAIETSDQDDSLTLAGTVAINGDVDARAGTDTLTFNTTTTTLGSGSDFNNFETVNISGENTLNGNIDLTGATVVQASGSVFHVNGNITAPTFTVGNNNTLGGNNTLTGDLIIASGGTASPGNSVGTINVVGNLDFASGSTFDVELDGNAADRMIATGNINIDNGATINVIPLSAFSGSVDVLSSTGGTLTGTFGTQNLNNQSVILTYSGTALNLTSFNNSLLGAQVSAGKGSGLLFADTTIEQSADYALSDGKYLWAKGLYRSQHQDTNGLNLGSESDINALAIGGQKSLSNNYKLGFSIADIKTDTEVKTGAGTADSNGVFASVHGTYTEPVDDMNMFATLGVMAGYRENDAQRRVNNLGVISFVQSDNQDLQAGAILQAGAQIPTSSNWSITPKISASYLHTYGDGYTEIGGGASGVSIDDYNFGTLKTSQSVRFEKPKSYVFSALSGANIRPYVEAGLAQETAIGSRDITGHFASGAAFANKLDDSSINFTTLKLGTDLEFADNINGFVSYQHSHSSAEQISDFRVGASLEF